jgi:hypothetical protein
MKPIWLEAEDARLLLQEFEPDSIHCTFMREGMTVYLGAESPKYLHDRMVGALLDTGRELDGAVDDHKIFRVLSLFDNHFVLFMSEEGDERYLFWQDAGKTGAGLLRMHLNARQRLDWAGKLEDLINPASS